MQQPHSHYPQGDPVHGGPQPRPGGPGGPIPMRPSQVDPRDGAPERPSIQSAPRPPQAPAPQGTPPAHHEAPEQVAPRHPPRHTPLPPPEAPPRPAPEHAGHPATPAQPGQARDASGDHGHAGGHGHDGGHGSHEPALEDRRGQDGAAHPAGEPAAGPGGDTPLTAQGTPARPDAPLRGLPDLGSTQLSPRHKVEAWLAVMVKSGASDLILRAGGRPSTRIDGRIGFLPGRVPGAGALLEVLDAVMGPDRMKIWREEGSVDSALHLDGLGRFRLNAYKQMGEPAVVLRRVSDKAPVLEELELPTSDLVRVALRKRGLVLVTGVAGSGKSTTLAALIQHMNMHAERHIVTLEDPIEILFSEKRCVISQREIGIDTPSFAEGLRHALRQSPDVLLIGEMRDKQTVDAALDASETGHLVLSTMHTVNAAQTIDRILGFYKSEQHDQVRQRLSDNLGAVLSQRLLPRASGKGLVPSFELMVQTPRIKDLLTDGDTGELARTIEQGTTPGLISFNQSLRRLVQQKLVELKDALAASDRPDELVLALRGITSSHGRRRGEGGGGSGPAGPGEGPGGGQPGPRGPGGPPPGYPGGYGGRGGSPGHGGPNPSGGGLRLSGSG